MAEYTISGRESVERIRAAVDHHHSNQGGLLPKANTATHEYKPPTDPPIRCYLLQDISYGEWGLAMQLERAHSANSFKVDLFGLWNLTTISFRLELEADGIVQFTTGAISGNGTMTADDMKAAIMAAGSYGPESLDVSLGNPYVSSNLLENSHTDGVPTETILGSWHITFLSYPTQILELKAIDLGGQVIAGSSLVVSRKTFDQVTGFELAVFDALDLSLPAPIRAGSKVICQPFAEGYGITSANQNDFHIGTGN